MAVWRVAEGGEQVRGLAHEGLPSGKGGVVPTRAMPNFAERTPSLEINDTDEINGREMRRSISTQPQPALSQPSKQVSSPEHHGAGLAREPGVEQLASDHADPHALAPREYRLSRLIRALRLSPLAASRASA
jgi:hypothetical protein